jgi:hypothetical protein
MAPAPGLMSMVLYARRGKDGLFREWSKVIWGLKNITAYLHDFNYRIISALFQKIFPGQ